MKSYAKEVLKFEPSVEIINENQELFDYFVGLFVQDQNEIDFDDPEKLGEFLGYKIGMFADFLQELKVLGWVKN